MMSKIQGRMIAGISLAIAMTLAICLVGGTSQAATEVTHTVHFTPIDFDFEKTKGYDLVRGNDGAYLATPGAPMLPVEVIRLALPDGLAVEQVRIAGSDMIELPGSFNLFPMQPYLKIGQTDDQVEFVGPDPDAYSSADPYPAEPVVLIDQSDLAGQAMVSIEVCPFRYVASEKKLYLYTSLELVVEGSDGYICGDYLPTTISEKNRQKYEDRVRKLVVNPEAVSLVESSASLPARLLPAGSFDHVIITTSTLHSYFQPLIDWHIRKGVTDTIITTTWIYGNYSGSNNQQRIRNFIIDAHNTWGTMYFLIGGENGDVPFSYRTYESESIPSDEYYGDFDDDWNYEVYVGRTTAENGTEVTRFVNKVLQYETNPALDDWALNITLLGMDLDDYTETESMKNYIDVHYLDSRFNVTPVYDSEAENHRTEFLNALNAGQGLINHSDHSYITVMGTGDHNHNWVIYTSNVTSMTNTNKLSVIYSLGCNTTQWDSNDCIAEYFITRTTQTGGVAFTGNTRSGFYYQGDPNSLSAQLDLHWWRGLMTVNQYRAGEALAFTKDYCPSNMSHWWYVHWVLNLLGEPEMPIWTDTIKTLTVTHPNTFPIGPSDFVLHVEDSDGVPQSQASVCLYKGSEIYSVEETDAFGDVTIPVFPMSLGEMLVTVTAQNRVPYQGSAECTGNQPPVAEFSFDPGIPTRHDTVQFTSTSWDDDGTLVSWLWDFGDDSTASGEEVSHRYDSYSTYTVTLIVQDNGGSADTTQSEITTLPLCGDINDDGIGPNIADLTYLVQYLFGDGPEPPMLIAANVDSIDGINIADLTYLIAYLFGEGADPNCPY